MNSPNAEYAGKIHFSGESLNRKLNEALKRPSSDNPKQTNSI